MNIKTAVLAAGITLLGMESAKACSAACFTGKDSETGQEIHMDGRSVDVLEKGFPIPLPTCVNIIPRGTAHDGDTLKKDLANPAKWTAQYGSLTTAPLFDHPGEGVNEKGLSFHALLQMDSFYQTLDSSTPCVASRAVGSYLLDNAATVSECIDLLGKSPRC